MRRGGTMSPGAVPVAAASGGSASAESAVGATSPAADVATGAESAGTAATVETESPGAGVPAPLAPGGGPCLASEKHPATSTSAAAARDRDVTCFNCMTCG